LNQYDKQYNDLVKEIIDNGYTDEGTEVRGRWESDDSPAYSKSVLSYQLKFDNTELPILTTKHVAWQSAIKELLWIWQKKSNRVQDLRDMGVNIWNQWERKDGSIGKAYGYVLGRKFRRKWVTSKRKLLNNRFWNIKVLKKYDQVDYLLHELKNNPSSKRHVTELWIPSLLDKMALTPCIHLTQWHVKEGKLHLEVRGRSNDVALGQPFNVFQYNVLQRIFAQVLGYELGEYTFTLGDGHIYSRHEQDLLNQIQEESRSLPELWINPDVKDFYDFTIDDFKLIDYDHGGRRKYEVVV
jgi:thymidylate synthase